MTSPPTSSYNCIACAAHEVDHWSQPGVFWPGDSPTTGYGGSDLEAAFLTLGFSPCDRDDTPKAGFEKVALDAEGAFYTHAARQLPSGRWTSKLGRGEDIEHETPGDVAGGAYGDIVSILRRPIPAMPPRAGPRKLPGIGIAIHP